MLIGLYIGCPVPHVTMYDPLQANGPTRHCTTRAWHPSIAPYEHLQSCNISTQNTHHGNFNLREWQIPLLGLSILKGDCLDPLRREMGLVRWSLLTFSTHCHICQVPPLFQLFFGYPWTSSSHQTWDQQGCQWRHLLTIYTINLDLPTLGTWP